MSSALWRLGVTAPLAFGIGAPSSGFTAGPAVLISGVFYDGFAPGDTDEAVQIANLGVSPVDLGAWRLADGEGTAAFPLGTSMPAGGRWWIAREAGAFALTFGHAPDWTLTPGGSVPSLITTGGGPMLANSGDEVVLSKADGSPVDAVVFGVAGRADTVGRAWSGAPVTTYSAPALATTNQVLVRKVDPASGHLVDTTNGPSDWASDPADPILGRRVRYPGWRDVPAPPAEFAGAARLEIAVAPDAFRRFLIAKLAVARHSIDILAYSFDNPALATTLAERARAGVRVRILLDGAPAGGHDLSQRWVAYTLHAAGAQVLWMDSAGDVRRRYRSAHAKLYILDAESIVIATENPSRASAPPIEPGRPTAGRRGYAVATDAPTLVAWARGIVEADMDPAFTDVRPYQERDPSRGAPPADYEPGDPELPGAYVPVAEVPFVATGGFSARGISSPETSLDPVVGLPGQVGRAGPGGEVLVAQLREPLMWGTADDPAPPSVRLNQRLAAYLAAARRGARVRVMLDGGLDSMAPRGANVRSAAYLNRIARQEGLDLEARLANPAGMGLHAKVVLVREGVHGPYSLHIGSINGTEVSSKANRELALEVQTEGAYRYVADVFRHDWRGASIGRVSLPTLWRH